MMNRTFKVEIDRHIHHQCSNSDVKIRKCRDGNFESLTH